MTTKRSWKLQEFVAHGANVNCLALGQQSGRVMVTGGDDKKVNMWAVDKPNCIMSLSGHTSPVECVRFNSNEELVAAGSQSGSLKIWDLEAAKIIRTLTGHKSNTRSLDFHPYGDFVASGSVDLNIKLWDIRRKGCIFTYKGHTGPINCIRFSPDGRWIASASGDGLVKLWDLTAGKLLHDFKLHGSSVNHVEFHPNEFLLATGSADKTVKFWDLETFELVSSTVPAASDVRVLVFHSEGSYLYSGSQDMLHVFGWEPVCCFDTFSMGWGRVADMAVASSQLIGASFNQTNVSVHIVDLERVNKTRGVSIQQLQQGQQAGTNQGQKPVSAAPLSASGRRSFITDRPPTTSTKQREPEIKSEAQRDSPTQDDKEDDSASSADIKDPVNYDSIFHPKKRLSRSQQGANHSQPLWTTSSLSQRSLLHHNPNKPASHRQPPRSPSRSQEPDHNLQQQRHQNRPRLHNQPDAAPQRAAKAPDTIVPSDRQAPAGLDMNAFLPQNMRGAGGDQKSRAKETEAEALDSLMRGHSSMCAVLTSRNKNLDVVRAIWTAGDIKTAVESAVNMRDQAIIVDLLNIMNIKKSLWSLDLCVILLPKIKDLLTSKYENYVHCGCASLKLILKSFTSLIKSNIKTPPSGVDISREERYQKCKKCYGYLLAVRTIVEDRQHAAGKVGSTFRELQLLLAQLD
ncbi:LOW QUALITY PROTEIN: katanin p80 WD40 repeat-containing subunit B1-like [Acanthaster planci]|uniref:Katanin p80 WD40 repeat-containing subunit B1 n=1 Tax=Acanthaster planci TaxID=133434 RepID=A0A8B7YK64_ACAPL|nr:LOW QUALITY PROTEIN: katanin p80 WD40 repeat-containing subunit B1-like [Acanthaster planci]